MAGLAYYEPVRRHVTLLQALVFETTMDDK